MDDQHKPRVAATETDKGLVQTEFLLRASDKELLWFEQDAIHMVRMGARLGQPVREQFGLMLRAAVVAEMQRRGFESAGQVAQALERQEQELAIHRQRANSAVLN